MITLIVANFGDLDKEINNLENQIPILRLKGQNPKKDPKFVYSALDWHVNFSQYAIEQFQEFTHSLTGLMNLSDFSEIPICNLEVTLEKSLIKIIDLNFARELDKNYCIWWYSHNS